MLYEMMLDMVSKGHKVTVISEYPKSHYCSLIECFGVGEKQRVKLTMRKCDVVITQLYYTQQAVNLALRYKKPIIHILHNDYQIKQCGINETNAQLIVANSQWLYNTINMNVNKIVVHPPIEVAKYEVENKGNAIVLINLIKAKGSDLFYQLAELMPNYRFIGVKGGYLVKKQIIPDPLPPNVEIWPNTPNIKSVYEQAKVVLMPSEAESWGRVAIEACCSGIPVIANKTIGLAESLGNAGIFADPLKPLLWVKIIESLYNQENNYKRRSALCKQRAIEVEKLYKLQMVTFNEMLERIVNEYN